MKLVKQTCREARNSMDFYLNHTAVDFANTELAEHLEICPACSNIYAARRRVKQNLQRAWRSTPAAPDSLRLSIKHLIRSEVCR